jgi:hypothetical protein
MSDLRALAQAVVDSSVFDGLEQVQQLAARSDEEARGFWGDLHGEDARTIARLVVAALNPKTKQVI